MEMSDRKPIKEVRINLEKNMGGIPVKRIRIQDLGLLSAIASGAGVLITEDLQ